MRNIMLTLEYDGTNYGGWQRQNNTMTVQQRLEESIEKTTQEKVKVIGCSRTDSGVHAKRFICNFHTDCNIPGNKIREAVNSKLSEDIRIMESKEVEESFHARYDSKGKTYSYSILNREICPALYRNYVCHVKSNLNVDNMKQAAESLIGKHDFASFKSTGSSVKTSIRTVSEINIVKEKELIKIFATADGFLYNMMRIIVGTLLEVGNGRRQTEEIKEILMACDRRRAGKSAPPQGLCLEKVYY